MTIANEIGSDKYFIAGNGAIVYDMKKKKEIIYENVYLNKKVLDIIKFVRKIVLDIMYIQKKKY